MSTLRTRTAALQDALHYALVVACGRGDYRGLQSCLAPRINFADGPGAERIDRSEFHKMAVEAARRAGYKGNTFRAYPRQERGELLVNALLEYGVKELGCDAYTDQLLTQLEGVPSYLEGLVPEAPAAAPAAAPRVVRYEVTCWLPRQGASRNVVKADRLQELLDKLNRLGARELNVKELG